VLGCPFLADTTLLPFQPPKVTPSSDVGSEKKIENETDHRKKNEDYKPGYGPVRVFLLEEDHSGDKEAVSPQESGRIFTDEVGKTA
jgi:hypothetical protein